MLESQVSDGEEEKKEAAVEEVEEVKTASPIVQSEPLTKYFVWPNAGTLDQ